MRHESLVVLALTACLPAALAQRAPAGAASTVRSDVSIGYNYIGANAPPGVSDDFSVQGGYVSGSFHVKSWFSAAGEFTGGSATSISALGQDLTLMTFTAGPRVSHTWGRFTPYGEALFGGAHGSNSYFPQGTTGYTSSATSFAMQFGGGVDFSLSDRWAIRLPAVDFLRTSFPNGSTDEQNQLMAAAGIVYHFGAHGQQERVTYAAPAPAQLSFSCTSDVAGIVQGQTLNVTGNTLTQPAGLPASYRWTSTGGTVEGTGNQVSINTSGLAPGVYQVTGHVMLLSQSGAPASSCALTFHVLAPPAEQPPAMEQPSQTKEDEIFHQNVPDALFDYDSYSIRADAQDSINKAAQYLQSNPQIGVLIAGYADDRGSTEYNLALAEKRADAAKNALMQAGISGDRLQIISYGKEAQVCTQQTEACYQQNRRAAFNMRH